MSPSSTASKEKGNAAFKAGDYAAAVGHYTAAAFADPSEPTFFLNRAAAYLKLSKNEDAERDCTTALGLSNNKNVKALFRRAQARAALQNLGEAHNDLQRALRLEPNNEAVKTELARVDGLIVDRKGKARSAPAGVTTPAPPPAPSSSTTAPPKRRRVPITIVDDDNSSQAITTQPTGGDDDLLLNPISSRRVPQPSSTPSPPPDGKPTPVTPASASAPTPAPAPAPAAPKPTPASFREAKQAREAKSVGRVGGGIFRVSGNDTVFKSRDVPAPAVTDPPKVPTPASAPSGAGAAAPRTLFEFTRAWYSIPSSDTATRWALLNSIDPTSLPALFGASLEPALLASLISVLAATAGASADRDRVEVSSRDAVRTVMCSLSRVSRFRTVVQFLSRAERNAARAVWEAVVRGAGDSSAEDAGDVEEAARTWGFTDA